jgi:hypothetical protein
LQPAEEQEANIRGARAAAKYCNQTKYSVKFSCNKLASPVCLLGYK